MSQDAVDALAASIHGKPVFTQISGKPACQTCHGDVARMAQVFKANNVNNMGFCISCHLQRNVSRDCSVCHY